MKQILEKHLQRQVAILKVLQDEEWHTAPDVAQLTGISTNTLRLDTNDLTPLLAPARLLRDPHLGVKLLRPDDLPLSYLYQQILINSQAFALVETALFNEGLTIDQLADKLYLSPATVRREIKRMNHLLIEENIQIQTKPLTIVGDEATIIWNCQQLLLEKYGSLEDIAKPAEANLVTAVIEHFFEVTSDLRTLNRQTFGYLNRLRLMTFVRLHRMKNGHFQQLPADVTSTLQLPKLPQKLLLGIGHFYHISWNLESAISLFYPFYEPNFIKNYGDQQLTSERYQNYVLAAEHFLKALAAFDFPTERQDYLLAASWNYLNQVKGDVSLLYSSKEGFVKNLERYYPYFAKQMLGLCRSFLEETQLVAYLAEDILGEMLFLLLTLWPDWPKKVVNLAPNLVAGLFFNTTYSHQLFVKQQLEAHFEGRLSFFIVNENNLPALFANSRHFDFLLTNFAYLKEFERPVLTIDTNPSERDYQKIRDLYQRLIQVK